MFTKVFGPYVGEEFFDTHCENWGRQVHTLIMSPGSEASTIGELLAVLEANLHDDNLSADDVEEYLSKIRHSPAEKESKYSQHCIEILCEYAFRPGTGFAHNAISDAALRCIEDALSSEFIRQMFVDLNYPVQVVEKLENEDGEYEYLALSILFLLTHDTKLDFRDLMVEHDLDGKLIRVFGRQAINPRFGILIRVQCLRHHADIYKITLIEMSRTQSEMTADNMALIRVCEVIFNIVHFHPELSSFFDPAVPSLVQLVCRLPLPYPVLTPHLSLQAPLSTVIYCLTIFNLDLSAIDNVKETQSVGDNPARVSARDFVNRLIDVLGLALEQYNDAGLESTALPLIMLLRKTFPTLSPEVQQSMRASLLLPDEERNKASGRSNSLSFRLRALTTSILAPTVGTSIAALLYELSDLNLTKSHLGQ